MTIFRSAYDTLACRDFVVKKIEQALKAALHTGQLTSQEGQSIRQLQGGSSEADHVPSFSHPFVLNDDINRQTHSEPQYTVVADVRSYGKFDRNQQKFAVRNKTEYAFILIRAGLNQVWIEAPQSLQSVTGLPMKMYASWISENVARRFALDMKEQGLMNVMAAFHYASLFMDAGIKLTQQDIHRIATVIKNNTQMPADMILGVLEQFEYPLNSIAELCAKSQAIVESVRLKELSVPFLFDLLASTWFGANKNEIVAVALEHPPTWLAILAMAADDRSYKKTYITSLLERTDRRDKGANLRRAIKVLLDAHA